jgi:hypothetical protein
LPRETDAELHVFRIAELGYSLKEGNLYPRWAPDFYYGYGYPIFNYYAPLTYHVGNWLTLLQPSHAVMGAKALFILAVISGAVGAYVLGREYGGQGGGLLGSLAFASSPYILLINPHIRGDLAEVLALAIMPWAFWFWERLWSGAGRWIFLGAITTASAVLLSHNLTGLTAMGLLVALSLWQWLGMRRRARFWPALIAGLFVVALTAYFWLPFLAERAYIRLNVTGEGHYDFRRHFVDLRNLLAPLLPLDWGATMPQFSMSAGPFGVFLALLGVGFRCLIYVRDDKIDIQDDKWHMMFYPCTAGFLFFLITPASVFLWQNLPGLHYYQFPWRFLGPLAVLLIPCVASVGNLLAWGSRKLEMHALREQGVLLLLGICLLTAMPGLYPPPWDRAFGEVSPQAMIDFELQGRARGTTSTDDFIPISVDVIPEPQASLIQSYAEQADLPVSDLQIDRVNRHTLPEGAQVEILPARAPHSRLHVQSPKKFLLRLYLFYFPGWRAYVDDEEVPIEVADPDGFITFWVPEGKHLVAVRFEDTLPRMIGWGVAGASLCMLLFFVALYFPKMAAPSIPVPLTEPRHHRTVAQYAIMLFVGVALFKASVADPLGWFHHTSPPGEARPARYDQSAHFGNVIDLLGYDLSSQMVKPGQTLDVTLYWRAQQPLTTPYRSFVHLVYPEGKVWTQSDHLNPGDFPTTRWPPGNRYVWDKHRLALPEAMPAGEYLLSVGLYTLTTGRLPVTGSTSGGRSDNVILEQRVTVR